MGTDNGIIGDKDNFLLLATVGASKRYENINMDKVWKMINSMCGEKGKWVSKVTPSIGSCFLDGKGSCLLLRVTGG